MNKISSSLTDSISKAASELSILLMDRAMSVTTAESLTGGMISSHLVSIPGCSQWFKYGFVTYSDSAKHDMLGIDTALIERDTAVSPNVASEMAQGALKISGADYSIAVTGLAGPGADKFGREAGLVYICIACKSGFSVSKFNFHGNRNEIREQTAFKALKLLLRSIKLDRRF